MIALYGGGNVSTCGFSSGGALPDFEAACRRANLSPGPVAAIALIDVVNDLLSALMLEIDINIWRLATLFGEKALE